MSHYKSYRNTSDKTGQITDKERERKSNRLESIKDDKKMTSRQGNKEQIKRLEAVYRIKNKNKQIKDYK